MLIERFNIPDPEFPDEEIESLNTREMLKRFRKEYSRHVRLRYSHDNSKKEYYVNGNYGVFLLYDFNFFCRVLNVIKQWVMHHFYDFERDPSLQSRLEDFLENADETKGKNCIFESVRRCLKKAVSVQIILEH